MLFWLLVYVTVLLSWFQSNMFQYVVYMRTLIKQHTKQIDQPLFGLLTWIVPLSFEDYPNSYIHITQEIQKFKIHKSSQRQGHHMWEFHPLSQGFYWFVFGSHCSRQMGKSNYLSPIIWKYVKLLVSLENEAFRNFFIHK